MPDVCMAHVDICLNCGASEPCALDKRETCGDPDNWPGSPCTFDRCGKPFLRAEDGPCEVCGKDVAPLSEGPFGEHSITRGTHAYLPPLTDTCEAGHQR
jgi:hypothetical protein